MTDEHHRLISQRAGAGKGSLDWYSLDISHLESGLAFVKANKFPRVSFRLLPTTKTKLSLDLMVLKDLPFLEGLDLSCRIAEPSDLSHLYSLRGLTELWLRTSLPPLDLHHFPHLQSLLLGRTRLRAGHCLSELKRIVVVDYTNDLAPELVAIPNLREIEMRGCKAASIDGFDRYPNIRSITLSYPQALARLNEVAASKTLERFCLERPSGGRLDDLSALGDSKSLESVWILQKEIASCEFVRHMPKLHSFYCNASIRDNDLQPILDSKSLRDVQIRPLKKSYSPRMTNAEINELLQSSG
jgi:hypothetical protein